MNKILTFNTYEDEFYRQMLALCQGKNLKAKIERYMDPQIQIIKKDLELTCIVELGNNRSITMPIGYYYQIQDYLPPASMRARGFQSIQELVNGVQELVQHMDMTRFYGAKTKPIFYTFTKQTRSLTEKEREEFEKLYWKEK